jgi:hypothetical protein
MQDEKEMFFLWQNELRGRGESLLFNRAADDSSYSPVSYPNNSLSVAALQLVKLT